MRTRVQIRQHIANLRTCVDSPCLHSHGEDPEHAWECDRGREMMLAAIGALEWALGEEAQSDLVEEMASRAARIRAGLATG